MNHFIEIRTYNLKTGTRDVFNRPFLGETMPLLKRWNVDALAYGHSLHDENSYDLMRRYDSLAHRGSSNGSDEWRKSPREAILALIENYTEIVIALDEATVQRLRTAPPSPLSY